jgi:sulfoxide reductase heme-binding subunit YedZ
MRTLLKSLVFVLALVPLGWLAFTVWTGRTGPNPAEDIILTTGIWALRFLLITLAITPVRRLTGVNVVIQYRRMLGLFAFFYACVHLFSYMLFDRLFQIGEVLTDIADRPFIMAGMTALALMIPLAVTSTKGWIRRLGRRWQTLHRIVYFSAAAACLHFAWNVKVVVGEPVYYAAILAMLLGFRLLWRLRLPERLAPRPARL